jgi:ribosomal protein L11 methyltransferase
MKWIEAKIEIHGVHDDHLTDVIAGVFYDIGLKGVLIEDPDLSPAEGWGDDRIAIPEHAAVTGYLPLNDDGRRRLSELIERQSALNRDLNLDLHWQSREIDEEDWAESWKKFFKPLHVARDLIIKPSWEQLDTEPGTMVIDIDPGMAFGTGTHPTTVLCLRLIREFLVEGGTFLDIGTGSGILSIAAAKSGAGSIVAVDTDPEALAIACGNLSRNGIAPERCRFILGHLLHDVTGRFDVVVANILTDVILALLIELPQVLKPGGIFIGSGIIAQHKERVLQSLFNHRLDIMALESLDGWIGVAVRRGREVRHERPAIRVAEP